MYIVWSDILFTVVLAFIWTLIFESPVIALEKIIFSRGKSVDKGDVCNGENVTIVHVRDTIKDC